MKPAWKALIIMLGFSKPHINISCYHYYFFFTITIIHEPVREPSAATAGVVGTSVIASVFFQQS